MIETPASTPRPKPPSRCWSSSTRWRPGSTPHPPHRRRDAARCLRRTCWSWLLRDFWRCNARLWRDKLGQISLATTTLFWGVSGNLRYIVLAWAAAALGYSTTQASGLVGVVAIGTAVGAVVASMRMRLDRATGVIPLGMLHGGAGDPAELHRQRLGWPCRS
jgi:hypothetical protein